MDEKQLNKIEREHVKHIIRKMRTMKQAMRTLKWLLDDVNKEYARLLDSKNPPSAEVIAIGEKYLKISQKQNELADTLHSICDG